MDDHNVRRMLRLLSQLDSACRRLGGDNRLRPCALTADAYHVAARFLLKTGDPGLAHVATDRSMTAALASQDPLTVGASGRILYPAVSEFLAAWGQVW